MRMDGMKRGALHKIDQLRSNDVQALTTKFSEFNISSHFERDIRLTFIYLSESIGYQSRKS
jgi:hypothetical protein